MGADLRVHLAVRWFRLATWWSGQVGVAAFRDSSKVADSPVVAAVSVSVCWMVGYQAAPVVESLWFLDHCSQYPLSAVLDSLDDRCAV